jgi:hypothetical protein
MDFLDGHPDYSGCRGTYSQFTLFSNEGVMVNTPAGESYTADPSECYSIENESFMERAEDFFKGVCQYELWLNWYCIFRADKIRSCLATIYKYDFADVVLNEILINLLLLREGKIKVIDQLFYVRQLGTSQASASIQAEGNVLELFLINDVFHHFNKFILQENLVDKEGERIRILKAFSYFIGIWCNGNYHPKPPVLEPLVQESPVEEPLVEENFMQKCKRIIKKDEMLYFLARKAVQLFRILRNYSKAQERQLDIRIPAIENQLEIGIPPPMENLPGFRIPAIERYVLKTNMKD